MTAVEKLVQTLIGFHDDFELAFSKEINKAKEMEKQQIIDAYNVGFVTPFHIDYNKETITGTDYYNEKFKK